jgi:hypothetical protein
MGPFKISGNAPGLLCSNTRVARHNLQQVPLQETSSELKAKEPSMTRRPGRAIIVGAGPAGMALAYLLARRGVEVNVLEMHHDFVRAFRGEGVQKSGIDAFRQMGLGEQFDHLPHTEMYFFEIYSRGRLVVRADAERLGAGRFGPYRSRRSCNCWPTRPAGTRLSASNAASRCATFSARMVAWSAFAQPPPTGRACTAPPW